MSSIDKTLSHAEADWPVPTIPFMAHHLRFTARVTKAIQFHQFKGSALRGALTAVLNRDFCPEWRSGNREPSHQAFCPSCQLVALERSDDTSGDVRRPYALTPPPGSQTAFEVGERFAFGLTLFGSGIDYLPYMVIAVDHMGYVGVGQKDGGKRGQFELERIDAVNPFSGEILPVMESEDKVVYSETVPIVPEQILATATLLAQDLTQADNLLRVDFLTPTRIMKNKQVCRQPDFFSLGKQVVLRLLDLSAQHGDGRPTMGAEPLELGKHIYPHLDEVRLMQDQTHWWELSGYSSRLKQSQELSGLMGYAIFHSPDWRPLLPWLLWGMSTQVGKNVVKGCGVYQIGSA